MRTWLVTGGTGFVGSRLVAHLRHSRPAQVDAVLAPTRPELDLADAGAVDSFIERHQVDGIVHLAASLDRSSSPEAERGQWRNTFEAGRTVVEQGAKHGVRRFVIAGTIEELGDQEGVLDVDREARPRTPYSLCKSLLREYASYVARRRPVRVDWFRPFVVYGPGQQGDMLIPSAFHAAVTGRPCDFTDGIQRRDFLFVDDLVAWIESAMGFPAEAGRFHVHHLGTGKAVPVREALEMIRAEFPDAPLRIGARSRRPGEPLVQQAPVYVPRDQGADSWRAQVTLRSGIEQTAAWWREAIHS
jgi:nucleoside-diphosphate-sugar epimerase